MFNENSRVKIPAIIQLTRLGYGYLSIKQPEIHSQIDSRTNIFKHIFIDSFPSTNLTDKITRLFDSLKNEELNSDDLGESFYNALLHGKDGLKLIDFDNFNRNTFNVVTELPYSNEGEAFRPDITILVNGMPLAFIEVKKPNNTNGINAELDRINERFRNPKFQSFIDITQLMIFSNNMEYDDGAVNSLSGAFYASPAQGHNASVKFNHFREQLPQEVVGEIKPINPQTESYILKDNNCQIIKDSPEYQTNTSPDSPTNRIIASLLCKRQTAQPIGLSLAYCASRDSSSFWNMLLLLSDQMVTSSAISCAIHSYSPPKP